MTITAMCCFAEDNQIISAMENKTTNRIEKKTRIFNKVPVVRDCRPGDN